MKRAMLTCRPVGAISQGMGKKTGSAIALAVSMGVGLTGCVNLEAPDKPIEINLNINIKQEVLYRLDREAKDTIKENTDIL